MVRNHTFIFKCHSTNWKIQPNIIQSSYITPHQIRFNSSNTKTYFNHIPHSTLTYPHISNLWGIPQRYVIIKRTCLIKHVLYIIQNKQNNETLWLEIIHSFSNVAAQIEKYDIILKFIHNSTSNLFRLIHTKTYSKHIPHST